MLFPLQFQFINCVYTVMASQALSHQGVNYLSYLSHLFSLYHYFQKDVVFYFFYCWYYFNITFSHKIKEWEVKCSHHGVLIDLLVAEYLWSHLCGIKTTVKSLLSSGQWVKGRSCRYSIRCTISISIRCAVAFILILIL